MSLDSPTYMGLPKSVAYIYGWPMSMGLRGPMGQSTFNAHEMVVWGWQIDLKSLAGIGWD